MAVSTERRAALRDAVLASFDSDRANGLDELLDDMSAIDARGIDRLVGKLERAMATPDEFYGTVREGVYARFIGRKGGIPEFEPKGSKGPDLGIVVAGDYANIEIKRLLDGETWGDPEDLEEWWANEHDVEFEPTGRDRGTDKVYAVITDAVRQLVHGEPNVVVVADWSTSATRGHFLRSTRLLQQEIEANQTYGRLSAAQYDANFLQDVNRYVWVNEFADVPLPNSIEDVLQRAAADKAREENDAVTRALGGPGR